MAMRLSGVMRRCGCGSACRRSGVRGRPAGRAPAARGGRSRRRCGRPAPAARAAAPRAPRPSAGSLRYGGSRRTRSYASPRSRASRSARRTGIRRTLRLRLAEPQGLEVGPDRGRRTGVALDQHGPRGAARERLDGQRARARRRGRARPRRPAARASRTAPRGRGRTSAASPARAAPAGGARRSARRRPSRRDRQARRLAEASCERAGQQRVLGLGQLGVAVEQLARDVPRAVEQRAVLGQPGEAEGRQRPTGACPSARPRRAARGRSRPGGSRRGARPAPAAAPPLAGRRGCTRTRARRGRCGRAAGAAARSRSARRPRRASPSRWGRRCRPR